MQPGQAHLGGAEEDGNDEEEGWISCIPGSRSKSASESAGTAKESTPIEEEEEEEVEG